MRRKLSMNADVASTKGQYMKELNMLPNNATIKQFRREVLHQTTVHEGVKNILAGNATIQQVQREILFNITAQYIKKSSKP